MVQLLLRIATVLLALSTMTRYSSISSVDAATVATAATVNADTAVKVNKADYGYNKQNSIHDDEEASNPEGMPAHRQLRDQCEWKTYQGSKAICPAPIQTCKVYSTFPEGEGYLHITRFGPFATTGGSQSVACQSDGHIAAPGSFLVRGYYTAVEPYTGDNLGYPPIHYHHVVPVTKDMPKLPANIKHSMPWLAKLEYETQFQAFPSSAADKQCLPNEGGPDCFIVKMPLQHGKRVYDNEVKPELSFAMQDVRVMDSPPLSWYMDLGEVYITQQHQQQSRAQSPSLPLNSPPLKQLLQKQPTLKPVLDFSMFIGKADNPAHTYPLQYNTSMLQFVTYYFSTRVSVMTARTHSHPINGDELWLLRGSQADLGIPQRLQRAADAFAADGAFGPTGDAIPLPKATTASIDAGTAATLSAAVSTADTKTAVDTVTAGAIGTDMVALETDLDSVKKAFELHLMKAASDFEHRNSRKLKTSNNNSSNSSNSSSHLKDVFIPFTSKTTTSTAKPEILCKYYASMETLTEESIEVRKQQLTDKFLKLGLVSAADVVVVAAAAADSMEEQGGRSDKKKNHQQQKLKKTATAEAGRRSYNSAYIPPRTNSQSAESKLVTAAQQLRALTTGLLPGEYYRRTVSSRKLGQQQHRQCNAFHIEAGEFITLVHFLQPRLQQQQQHGVADRFDEIQFAMTSHSIIMGEAAVPDIPYL